MGARPNHGCYVIRASPDGLGFRLYWQANPTARDTAFEYGGKDRRLFRSIAEAREFVRQRWGQEAIIELRGSVGRGVRGAASGRPLDVRGGLQAGLLLAQGIRRLRRHA
jgi:hypothetical protein